MATNRQAVIIIHFLGLVAEYIQGEAKGKAEEVGYSYFVPLCHTTPG